MKIENKIASKLSLNFSFSFQNFDCILVYNGDIKT